MVRKALVCLQILQWEMEYIRNRNYYSQKVVVSQCYTSYKLSSGISFFYSRQNVFLVLCKGDKNTAFYTSISSSSIPAKFQNKRKLKILIGCEKERKAWLCIVSVLNLYPIIMLKCCQGYLLITYRIATISFFFHFFPLIMHLSLHISTRNCFSYSCSRYL